jgi:thiamine biosynthesis lipoprotein
MASPLRLSVAPGGLPDDVTKAIVDAAWTIVRATFEVAEAVMSRFRDDSELTRLNRRAPQSAQVSRTLARGLTAADRARRVTGGRFDPRIVEALERIGYSGVPQRPAVAAARRRPAGGDSRIVERSGRAGPVVVRGPVDLGGIG